MRAPRFFSALVALIGGTLAVGARLPAVKLTWVFPPGAPTGSTNTVTVAGSDLDEPAGLVFSDPRITALPRPDGSPVFTVIVPADVAPGLIDVRFAGRFGVSNPRGFQVGASPEYVVNPTNTSPGSAFELALGSVANGRVQPASTHWFRFEARKGQRLLGQVQARELDSRLLPDLAILTSSRRELRVARRSAWVEFVAPEDGSYFLRLNDQTYRGGDDYVYRVAISSRPQIEFALPLTLTSSDSPASPARATLFGRNLPGSVASPLRGMDGQTPEMLEVTLGAVPARPQTEVPLAAIALRKPAAAVLAGDFVSLPWGGGDRPASEASPVSLTFLTTPFPTSWSLSNDLVSVTPPCDFSGLFPRRGELSGVRFDAKKDTVYWVEVFSERLGFNTDPLVVIQRVTRNDKGEEKIQDLQELSDIDTNLGGREFDTTSRDAVGRFKVPDDGTYRILVRDLYRGGAQSPRLPYRLQIRPESPDFRLAVFPQPPPRKDDNDRQIHLWSLAIRPGGTMPLRVVAFRRDGFDGPIELSAHGLPPGITAAPARIAPGQTATTLILAASTNAPSGPGRVTVSGRARLGDRDVDRDALASSGRWHIPDWDQERGAPRFSASLNLGVVAGETAPVSLTPTASKALEVPAKGKLQIPLAIARRGDFQGAFKLKPWGHSSLEKAKETDVPEKSTNVVVEIDLGEAALPEGEHIVHLEGTVSGKYRNNPGAAEAAEATAKTAATEATDAAAHAKKAEERLVAAKKAEDEAAAAFKAAQDKAATGNAPASIEARTSAEKHLDDVKAARLAAERALSEAQALAKTADDRKTATAAAAKAAVDKAQPKDVSIRVYSTPVVVRVTPPPKAG